MKPIDTTADTTVPPTRFESIYRRYEPMINGERFVLVFSPREIDSTNYYFYGTRNGIQGYWRTV